MRYSLSSRFRGTLLGAALTETLASDGKPQPQSCSNCGQVAVLAAESLIALGRLDLDDWRYRQQQKFSNLDAIECFSAKAIVATLPVALFFHENEQKLRQNLLQVAKIWQDDPVVRDGALAVGYAISKSLTEKLHPAALIPQTISFLGETPTCLPQQLLTVNTMLNQGAGLERTVTELSRDEKPSSAIAIAFYCFLSTLEDLRLSVLRAIHNSDHLLACAAITGALSGAYNSMIGIPVGWRVALSPDTNPLTGWGVTSEAEMLELADCLLAVWSGVYHEATHPVGLQEKAAIAAPHVIRLR